MQIFLEEKDNSFIYKVCIFDQLPGNTYQTFINKSTTLRQHAYYSLLRSTFRFSAIQINVSKRKTEIS